MNPYTSTWSGVTEGDGPQECHVVLLDNGRSRALADEVGRQALRCIRCSACLNICPVYERTGGHAYGSVYPGPIGAILNPLLKGVGHSDQVDSLPFASSLCGACYEVCPVKIDIPTVLVDLRAQVVDAHRDDRVPKPEAAAMKATAWAFADARRLALGQRAGELETDHPRDQHRHRLPQHGRLGLDTADAPTQYTQAVDHRGVGVGADAGVRVGLAVADHDRRGQVFDVDLVHDAHARRDDAEVVERALAPAQELVALTVALVFEVDVALEGVGAAEHVQDDRVVDDHVGGGERVHLVRVAAEGGDGFTHRREVDDAGDAGEVLHDHARGRELDLDARLGRGIPVRDGADVVFGDVRTVFGAEKVLGENLEGIRQFLGAGYCRETEDLVGVLADLERSLGAERINAFRHVSSTRV